jgi:dihydrofolate reductase
MSPRTPSVVLVVAAARNGIIGADGGLPWRLKSDLRRFRKLTMGKPVIMGRKTYESIGRPLDGRDNIVISTRPDFAPTGVIVVRSFDAALEVARGLSQGTGAGEICVIGGGVVFREALAVADRILLTEVLAEPRGDVSFPALAPADWMEISREPLPHDGDDTAEAVLVTLDRRRAG